MTIPVLLLLIAQGSRAIEGTRVAGAGAACHFHRPARNGLLALALTPLLRRHSDSDKPSRTRVATSPISPGGSRPCSVSIALHPSWLGSASPRAGSPRWRHAATTASAA